MGSIPAAGDEKFRYSNMLSLVSFAGMTLNKCAVLRIGTLTGAPPPPPPVQGDSPLCRLKNPTVVYMTTCRLSSCKTGVYNVHLLIILERGCSSMYRKKRKEIAPVICLLFERSLQTGQLPAEWTKAQVCPLFKKGDKCGLANYRPISLTCILCKVMEYIIASNISKHLTQHDILYELKHGFREKRSCETQLIQLVEDLNRRLTLGNQTDVVLLDFSKASDKVNHLKLLLKLTNYGIKGNTLNWIKSFLIGRSQTVVLDGES